MNTADNRRIGRNARLEVVLRLVVIAVREIVEAKIQFDSRD